MRRARGSALLAAAGLVAVGFLLVMVVSGRTRPTQNLVTFEAAGLMRETPDQIDRVELTAEGRRSIFTRRGPGRWTVAPSAGELGVGAVSHLEMSLEPPRIAPTNGHDVQRSFSLDRNNMFVMM